MMRKIWSDTYSSNLPPLVKHKCNVAIGKYCADIPTNRSIGVSEIGGPIKQCQYCKRIYSRDEFVGVPI